MEQLKAIAGIFSGKSEAKRKAEDLDFPLVKRAQAGEVAAFDELVLKYRERIYAVIYNMTSNREDAADLTQEAFIKAFQSIKQFKFRSSFFTWIYRIAVNTSISFVKKSRARRYYSFDNLSEELPQSDFLEALAARNRTEKGALLKELQEKLNEALQTLSIKHRTVVILHEIEGLSHGEIADIVKCSEGTVRSRLHYAKQELQAQLKSYLN